MSLRSRGVFLLVGFCFILCYSKKVRYSTARKRTNQNVQVPGSPRVFKDLPSLEALLSGAEKVDGGMKYMHQGCEVVVLGKGEQFSLDLTNEKCKNIVSLKNLFSKLIKAPDKGTERFTTLDKFNVEKVSLNTNTKYVTFEATSKEPFQLMWGLEVSGKVEMKFTYKGASSATFQTIGITVDGDVKIGNTNLKYNIEKTENTKEGKFSIAANQVKISDFYKAFTKNAELDNTKLADKKFADTVVNNPTIQGSRDEDGNSELVLTATATDIPGLSKGSFAVVVNAPYETKPSVGVVVEFTGVSPATILSKLIPKINIADIPIFKDITITVIIEYANADIQPKNADLLTLLKKVSLGGQINKGLKMKFKMPFKEVLQKQGVTAPPNTNLNQYVTVNFNDGKVSFDFPPNAGMDIINIAIALVPGFTKPALERLFKSPPQVTFKKFEVDVKGSVDVELEATGNIGFRFLTVDWLMFTLRHQANGPWDFSLKATKMIGQGVLEMIMIKEKDDYQISGGINRLSTGDITEGFKVDSKMKAAFKNMKSLNMALEDVKVKMHFGNKLDIQFSGKATFLRMQAIFEGYVVEVTPDSTAVAFGIVLHNQGISDIAKELFKTENNPNVKILDQKWMSKVTTSIIFANKAAIDEITFEDENLKTATKPTDIGISFHADVLIPENCEKEVLCEFVKTRIGANQHLILNGVIQKTKISLDAAFSGNIAIGKGDKYTIEKAGFMVTAGVGETPEFSIYGEMRMSVANQSAVLFKAKIGLSATLTISLQLAMDNMLKSPFGFDFIEIGNLNMEAGINVVTAMPALSLHGMLRLGKSGKAIQADIAGGFDATTGKFHLYGKFGKLNLRSAFEAFETKSDTIKKIPSVILDTGFPDGVVAGFALPTPQELPTFGVTLEPGFFLKGRINLLGFQIECEILLNIPAIVVKAKFDKITTAGKMIQLSNVDDRSKGPEFELSLGNGAVNIQINAYAEVLGIGIGAKIDITNAGFNFAVEGKFLNLFKLEVKLSAPFREKITSLAAKEWTASACLDTNTNADQIKEIVKEAGNDVQGTASDVKGADDNNKEIKKTSGDWYQKAEKKLASAKKKLGEYEKEFHEAVKKAEEKKNKAKYKKDCVKECEKKKIWIGGLIEVDCPQLPTIKCPSFKEKKFQAISPECLATCNPDMMAVFKGWYKGKTFTGIQSAMKYYTKLLGKLQVFLVKSKKLYDNTETARAKLAEIAKEGNKFVDNAKKWVKKNVIDLKRLCINSALREDYCFSVDADFSVFGQQPIKLEQEEGCFTGNWVKNIAQKILLKAFPSMEQWKEKAKLIKGLLMDSKAQAKDIKNDEKALKEAEDAKMEKRTIEEDMDEDDSQFAEILGTPPDYVVRNDASMQAYRDLFFRNDEEIVNGRYEVDDNGASVSTSTMMVPIKIDPTALSTSGDGNSCRRTEAVVNIYQGVSDSLNVLLQNNKAAKDAYEAFTEDYSKKFDSLEKEIRAKAQMNNMSEFDTSEMLFYVTYGREGVANWRRQFSARFNILDKSSLIGWKAYMTKKVSEKNMDMTSFTNLLKQASKEMSKKWEIPGKASGIKKNMNYAEQMMLHIMATDDQGLLAHEPSIKNLATAVQNLQRFSKVVKCPNE